MGQIAQIRLHEHGVVLGAQFRRRVSGRLRAPSFITKIAEAAGRPGPAGLPAGFSSVSSDGLRRHTDPDAITTETRNTSTRRHAVARNFIKRSEEHGLRRFWERETLHGEVARAIESRSRGGVWFLS